MPPRGFGNKSNKKRWNGKKRNYYSNSGRAMIGLGRSIGADPFPSTFFASMTYVDRVTITPSIPNVLTEHLFSCNGLWSPNISGISHSPLGFDEIMQLYNHYEVYGSKIVVDFQGQTTTPALAGNVIVGIHINDDTSIQGNNLDQLLENGNTTYKILTSESQKAHLEYKWSQQSTFGRYVRGNREMQGTQSANPTEMSYYALYTQNVDKVTVGSPVTAVVRITFFAKFSERKDVPQS